MKNSKHDKLFAPFLIEMDEHPKIVVLSDAAFRALIEGVLYCRRMLTDGFLDERIVLRKWGEDVANELCSNDPKNPSWVRVEGGFQVHDFEKYHPLKAEIDSKRADISAKRSQAGSKGAAKRWQTDGKAIAKDGTETETETETIETNKLVSLSAKRAKRIDPDFAPDEKLLIWAREKAANVDVERETEKFVNYWLAKAGKDAAKLDWGRTWQNWVLNAAERYSTNSASVTRLSPAQQLIQTMALANTSERKELNG